MLVMATLSRRRRPHAIWVRERPAISDDSTLAPVGVSTAWSDASDMKLALPLLDRHSIPPGDIRARARPVAVRSRTLGHVHRNPYSQPPLLQNRDRAETSRHTQKVARVAGAGSAQVTAVLTGFDPKAGSGVSLRLATTPHSDIHRLRRFSVALAPRRGAGPVGG